MRRVYSGVMTNYKSVCPRLPTYDLEKTVRFYRDRLGFRPAVLWPEESPTFVILTRNQAEVQFVLARADTADHDARADTGDHDAQADTGDHDAQADTGDHDAQADPPEQEGRGDLWVGDAELVFEVDDAQSLHEALRSDTPMEWGPEVYWYGRREFAVRDPNRYLVIFTEVTDDPPTCDG